MPQKIRSTKSRSVVVIVKPRRGGNKLLHTIIGAAIPAAATIVVALLSRSSSQPAVNKQPAAGVPASADFRKDIARHRANGGSTEKENQGGQHIECVWKSQRESNNAHLVALRLSLTLFGTCWHMMRAPA